MRAMTFRAEKGRVRNCNVLYGIVTAFKIFAREPLLKYFSYPGYMYIFTFQEPNYLCTFYILYTYIIKGQERQRVNK